MPLTEGEDGHSKVVTRQSLLPADRSVEPKESSLERRWDLAPMLLLIGSERGKTPVNHVQSKGAWRIFAMVIVAKSMVNRIMLQSQWAKVPKSSHLICPREQDFGVAALRGCWNGFPLPSQARLLSSDYHHMACSWIRYET